MCNMFLASLFITSSIIGVYIYIYISLISPGQGHLFKCAEMKAYEHKLRQSALCETYGEVNWSKVRIIPFFKRYLVTTF